MLRHEVSDDSRKRLPLFLTLFLEVGKEVLVWLEHGQSGNGHFPAYQERGRPNDATQCLHFNHAIFVIEVGRIVPNDLGLHRL